MLQIADLEHQLEAFRDQIVEKDDELQQLIAQNEITEREANHHQEELTSQLAQAVATRAQHEVHSRQTETDRLILSTKKINIVKSYNFRNSLDVK